MSYCTLAFTTMTKLAFVFILFVLFANAEINEGQSDDEKNDEIVKSVFDKLLKSIVNINEQRYDAMKKVSNLQDDNVAMDVLRNGMDSEESDGSLLALLIVGEEKSQEPIEEQLMPEEEEEDSVDTSDVEEAEVEAEDQVDTEKENALRVWKSCQKRAAKVCKKACADAYKTTCSEYACSKKMKKTFHRECKIACKNRFH